MIKTSKFGDIPVGQPFFVGYPYVKISSTTALSLARKNKKVKFRADEEVENVKRLFIKGTKNSSANLTWQEKKQHEPC